VNLQILLDMAVAFDPDRIAITDPTGAHLSSRELDLLARQAAQHFVDSGAACVGYCATNGRALPVSLFGSVAARLPFVPLNYRLADAQLGEILQSLDLVIVADARNAPRLERLGVTRIIDPESLFRADDAHPRLPPFEIDPDDIALLLHTSGTTAAPKAAVLRHSHLSSYVIGTVEFGAADPEDAVLVVVPPYHVAGVMNLLSNLYLGRRIVYLDAFDPDQWLEVVRREAVTHAMLVPTMLARVIDSLHGVPPDLPTLRSLSYGGARMPAPVIDDALRLFPSVEFTNAYGLTETSSTISVLGPADHRAAHSSSDPRVRARMQSAGLPLPGIEIAVRDADGAACAPAEVGDIFVRGEQVAGEYLGADAGDTPSAPAGWFATRDQGYLDDAGYLFVEGRSDDTIIRGGENIAPAEIEDALLRHESVADCAVVGLDDEEWGQRIAAAVVVSPGAVVTPAALQVFAREHLRTAKCPDVVVLVESLPYTDTGKLVRRAVRERILAPES
jgi:acyl-CoA synthetase (AMP-forming)/AMP-acid ligase II